MVVDLELIINRLTIITLYPYGITSKIANQTLPPIVMISNDSIVIILQNDGQDDIYKRMYGSVYNYIVSKNLEMTCRFS